MILLNPKRLYSAVNRTDRYTIKLHVNISKNQWKQKNFLKNIYAYLNIEIISVSKGSGVLSNLIEASVYFLLL